MEYKTLILGILLLVYIGLEITVLIFLIKESVISLKAYDNFQRESLYCPKENSFELMGCTNYGEAYPYELTSTNYLCKEEYSNIDIKQATSLKQPNNILDELSNHSREWTVMFFLSYSYLIINQAFIVVSFIVFKCCICCGGVLVSFVTSLLGFTKVRLHALFLIGSLMSIFLIFDFSTCIHTPNKNSYQIISAERSIGVTFFIVGLGTVPLYYVSCWLGVSYLRSRKRGRQKKLFLICYLILELLFLILEIVLFIHWKGYYIQINHEANNYHNLVLDLCIIISKSLQLFFWIYFGNFYSFESMRIIPIISQQAPEITLTLNQISVLNQIDTTAIIAEEENTLERIVEKIKGGRCCNICLDDIRIGEQISNLRCDHIFHHECLSQWIRNNRYLNCPNCRAPIESKETEGGGDITHRPIKYQLKFLNTNRTEGRVVTYPPNSQRLGEDLGDSNRLEEDLGDSRIEEQKEEID